MNRFLAGYLTSLCLNSLCQDAFGKAEYIDFLSKNWVDATYSVPVAIIGIVIAVTICVITDK